MARYPPSLCHANPPKVGSHQKGFGDKLRQITGVTGLSAVEMKERHYASGLERQKTKKKSVPLS